MSICVKVDDYQVEFEVTLDRVPVPVIPIQGRTLLKCKNGGSIGKFEAPNL